MKPLIHFSRFMVLVAVAAVSLSCRMQRGTEIRSAQRTRRRRHFAARTMQRSRRDAKTSLGDEQWSAGLSRAGAAGTDPQGSANNYDVRIAAQRILEQQAQVRITRSQQFPNRYRSAEPASAQPCRSSLGTQIPKPAGERIVQCFGRMDAGFLGTLSQADRGCARAVAGADVGAARSSD